MKQIKVGIIGFGTVGAGVADILLKNGDVISSRAGVELVLARIADLDITTDRGVKVPAGVLTTDAAALIDEVDVVVELIGGKTVAKDFILKALNKGKMVVTANKALLAEYGKELFAAAEANNADIYYEASVGGGIPVISENGKLVGVNAVIDKDNASSLLAAQLGADYLVILTAVEKVAINFGKENQEWLSDLTVEQAKEYIAEEQFAKGSMLPKIEAAIRFAESGEGRRTLITLLDKAAEGIAGKTGTVIHQ